MDSEGLCELSNGAELPVTRLNCQDHEVFVPSATVGGGL